MSPPGADYLLDVFFLLCIWEVLLGDDTKPSLLI